MSVRAVNAYVSAAMATVVEQPRNYVPAVPGTWGVVCFAIAPRRFPTHIFMMTLQPVPAGLKALMAEIFKQGFFLVRIVQELKYGVGTPNTTRILTTDMESCYRSGDTGLQWRKDVGEEFRKVSVCGGPKGSLTRAQLGVHLDFMAAPPHTRDMQAEDRKDCRLFLRALFDATADGANILARPCVSSLTPHTGDAASREASMQKVLQIPANPLSLLIASPKISKIELLPNQNIFLYTPDGLSIISDPPPEKKVKVDHRQYIENISKGAHWSPFTNLASSDPIALSYAGLSDENVRMYMLKQQQLAAMVNNTPNSATAVAAIASVLPSVTGSAGSSSSSSVPVTATAHTPTLATIPSTSQSQPQPLLRPTVSASSGNPPLQATVISLNAVEHNPSSIPLVPNSAPTMAATPASELASTMPTSATYVNAAVPGINGPPPLPPSTPTTSQSQQQIRLPTKREIQRATKAAKAAAVSSIVVAGMGGATPTPALATPTAAMTPNAAATAALITPATPLSESENGDIQDDEAAALLALLGGQPAPKKSRAKKGEGAAAVAAAAAKKKAAKLGEDGVRLPATPVAATTSPMKALQPLQSVVPLTSMSLLTPSSLLPSATAPVRSNRVITHLMEGVVLREEKSADHATMTTSTTTMLGTTTAPSSLSSANSILHPIAIPPPTAHSVVPPISIPTAVPSGALDGMEIAGANQTQFSNADQSVSLMSNNNNNGGLVPNSSMHDLPASNDAAFYTADYAHKLAAIERKRKECPTTTTMDESTLNGDMKEHAAKRLMTTTPSLSPQVLERGTSAAFVGLSSPLSPMSPLNFPHMSRLASLDASPLANLSIMSRAQPLVTDPSTASPLIPLATPSISLNEMEDTSKVSSWAKQELTFPMVP